MVDNYPDNSHTSKAQASKPADKHVQQITTGVVKQRKKPLGTRFKETFLGENGVRGVWGFVLEQVLVPAAKDMIADATIQGVERTVFGETRSRGRISRGAGPTRYDAMAPSSRGSTPAWRREPEQRQLSAQARRTHSFDEIVLESRGEAEQVIDTLYDLVNQYGQATVADLYSLVGITADYTNQKYGWTELRGSTPSHVRGGGYLLNLPTPIELT